MVFKMERSPPGIELSLSLLTTTFEIPAKFPQWKFLITASTPFLKYPFAKVTEPGSKIFLVSIEKVVVEIAL